MIFSAEISAATCLICLSSASSALFSVKILSDSGLIATRLSSEWILAALRSSESRIVVPGAKVPVLAVC